MKKPARALVIYSSSRGHAEEMAKEITEGARRTPALVTLAEASPEASADSFDLVFLGSDARSPDSPSLSGFIDSNEWENKRVALFACNKRLLEEASRKLSKKGGKVIGTLNLRVKGPFVLLGFGRLEEEDLIRARGFGERTTNTAFSFTVKRNKDKHGIKGYLKKRG